MNELKQKAWLLIIIAILATTKFILLPILEWQNAQLTEIQLLKKKLAKTQYVLNNKEKIERLNQQLSSILEQSKPLFFKVKNDSLFKLNQQKMMENLLAKFSLSSQNIGWKNSIKLAELGIKQYQLELKVKGKTLNIIQLMTELETVLPRIEIENFNISIKRQKQDDLGFSTARITLNLYNQYANDEVIIENKRIGNESS